MEPRIFVSATCKDLEQDCRPAVLEAMEFAEVFPITMETWMADYLSAVALCRQQLEDNSTHYIGVFAYWRGWVPDGETRSITEIEYDLAVGRWRTQPDSIAMFLPREPSDFADGLRERAKELLRKERGNVTDEQLEAEIGLQREFLRRVMAAGAVEHFRSVVNLALRVNRRARAWSAGGLRAVARSAPARRPVIGPSATDVAALGHDEHEFEFGRVLKSVTAAGGGRAVCFLVHGPPDHGHDELVAQLTGVLAARSRVPPRQLAAGVELLVRGDGASDLVAAIGADLTPGAPPATVDELALALSKVLAVGDVVVKVSAADAYDGGVAGFAREVWQPLIAALPADHPNRLVWFATAEVEAVAPEWEAAVQASDAKPLDPARLVVLPPLAPITREDLVLWLEPWLRETDPGTLADALLRRTRGVPLRLYRYLTEESTWIR